MINKKLNTKKKILFVGMPFSIHVVRWINLLKDSNFEIHFFSSFPYAKPNKEFSGAVYYDFFYNYKNEYPKALNYKDFSNNGIFLKHPKFNKWIGKGFRFLGMQKKYHEYLKAIIIKIRPEIIHTMETQHAGYLVNEIYNDLKKDNDLPVWIHSTWGLDIDYFQHFPDHLQKLKDVFSKIDFFISEGERDLKNANDLGFSKKSFVFPCVAGGYDLSKFKLNQLKPSERRKILIKGEQDSVRRGLVALRALVKCKDLLSGIEVIVYSSAKEVKDYVQYINSKEGLSIVLFNNGTYDDWLRLLSGARISINNNLSDGNPSCFFEAMLMGAFPIQSENSCADEWIKDNVNGFIVPAEDPEIIQHKIRKALVNDPLVDQAAILNYDIVASALNFERIQTEAIQMYSAAINLKLTRAC